MSSLGEVQRIIGLSLSKIQMGRNQRGGLPLHKNLLVATVLNKARDVYMQETMYMNYRLMACGQFNQEDQEDIEDDDTPETEDYEEDSESDVEDDSESAAASKDFGKELVSGAGSAACLAAAASAKVGADAQHCAVATEPALGAVKPELHQHAPALLPAPPPPPPVNSDEGFIDESDCDCDARNFGEEGETRVPFQYCFSCAPFHPSNGRGPTLVGPGQVPATPVCPAPGQHQDQEDKLIYDMDSKSTQNQSSSVLAKRKRQISSEETEDAVNSILSKKRRDSNASEEPNLDDSGFQEDEKVFHPAFRGQSGNNGMEVDQITSLVSIFSFGQQLFNSSESSKTTTGTLPVKKVIKEDDDSDSDSDTSSDSGHSSDDHETNNDEKSDETGENNTSLESRESRTNKNSEMRCSAQAKEKDLEVSSVSVAAAV